MIPKGAAAPATGKAFLSASDFKPKTVQALLLFTGIWITVLAIDLTHLPLDHQDVKQRVLLHSIRSYGMNLTPARMLRRVWIIIVWLGSCIG